MNEVIVRMEMPSRCDKCYLRFVCPNFINFFTTKEPGSHSLIVGMDGCLIICALPENHGRLVDADELESRCRPVKNFENTDSLVIGVGPLRCSKTIVPATETEATPCP